MNEIERSPVSLMNASCKVCLDSQLPPALDVATALKAADADGSDAELDGTSQVQVEPPPQFLQNLFTTVSACVPPGYFMTAKRVVKHVNDANISDCYDENGVFKFAVGSRMHNALMAAGRFEDTFGRFTISQTLSLIPPPAMKLNRFVMVTTSASRTRPRQMHHPQMRLLISGYRLARIQCCRWTR